MQASAVRRLAQAVNFRSLPVATSARSICITPASLHGGGPSTYIVFLVVVAYLKRELAQLIRTRRSEAVACLGQDI